MSRLFAAFLIALLILSIGGVARAKDKCEKLRFFPEAVKFGLVYIGKSSTETLLVGNSGEHDNAVDIASVGGPEPPFAIDSTTCVVTLAPGDTCKVNLTFTPTQVGKKTDKVNFIIPGCPKQTVEMSGRGVKAEGPTATATATATATPTATATATATPTATATATPTATATATQTATPTATATATATSTSTATATATPGILAWVANSDSSAVTSYPLPLGTTANIAPFGAFQGGNTDLSGPNAVAVDLSGNIYVLNLTGGPSPFLGSVTVFPGGGGGVQNIKPSAEIAGTNTTFANPIGLALDSSRNIYVANTNGGPNTTGSVLIFASGSNGNVAPSTTIAAAGGMDDNTTLCLPRGIALDSLGSIYVLNPQGQSIGGCGGTGSIAIYSPGSSGNVAPAEVIAGDLQSECLGMFDPFPCCTGPGDGPSCVDNTQLDAAEGIALDSSNRIYVANCGAACEFGEGDPTITIYPAGSTGNAAPLAVITGINTGLSIPAGVAIDAEGNIYVTNAGNSTITEYAPLAETGNLNIPPISLIVGDMTQLALPLSIAVDPLFGK